MKRVGAIAFTVVLALAVLGVGYARWADTLTVHAAVQTGTVKWGILRCSTTDAGTAIDQTVGSLDPRAPDSEQEVKPMDPPEERGQDRV